MAEQLAEATRELVLVVQAWGPKLPVLVRELLGQQMWSVWAKVPLWVRVPPLVRVRVVSAIREEE